MRTTCWRAALALLFVAASAAAADLTSLGDWTETLTAADLVGGAGTDLPNQLESVAGVTTLTISNAPGAWTVRVRRGSGHWNNDFALFVKRTSAGSGSGTISGGESFVEITGTDSEIFSGSEARSGVSLQFKLTGLARNVSAATYSSSLIFTVQ